MGASLWRILWDGFRSWLKRDAIRTSPTDRLWLSIQTPCSILWQGERIDVLNRRDVGTSLEFECLTPRGHETLIVHPGSLHQPPRYEWGENGDSRIEDDKWKRAKE